MHRTVITRAMKAPRTGITVLLKLFGVVFDYSNIKSTAIIAAQAGGTQYHTITCYAAHERAMCPCSRGYARVTKMVRGLENKMYKDRPGAQPVQVRVEKAKKKLCG